MENQAIAGVIVTFERKSQPKWFTDEIATGRIDESYWEMFKTRHVYLCADCFERFKHHAIIAAGRVIPVGEDDWEVCGESFSCKHCGDRLPRCSDCKRGHSLFAMGWR